MAMAMIMFMEKAIVEKNIKAEATHYRKFTS
ncbi:MAG: hypothetical protein RLY16_2294 [Bacteroidota bacterium]|jgi:hypothetical protein